jgi:membrane-associated phospholipid phosphatase
VFRYWYALPLVGSCYKEMAIVIPAVRGTSSDQWLADLDYSIWHANPTVWLERVQTPALTDFLQLVYTLFVPAVLLVPFLLWRRRRFADFRYCAFLISLGFLASYIGYVFVPARGPRFLLDHLQHAPLQGGWLVDATRATLDRLESAHYDCFPSGHTELSIIVWWSSRQISKRLGWAYLAYTVCIIFATVYLRYHYTVDLAAGAVLAAVLIAAGPMLFRKLSGREDSIGA